MSLSEYRRKRRFDRTREPAPERAAKSGRAIFVVQLHHARRRHYDFRLQVGDALKSWAVPKGPSFDPKVKRLAAEVEDHPLAYADFEGEIPQGEYGGGHVALFDRGVWATEGDAEAQLAKGHLRFELFGDKLKGAWHLVRTARPARQPEWLLFKAEDEFAGAVEADDLLGDVAPPDGRGGRRAAAAKSATKAAKKTAKPEAAKKTAAAAKPAPRRRRVDWRKRAEALPGARAGKLRDAPFEPQLARLVDQPPAGGEWLHEIKWDGYRLLAVIRDGGARIWSRNALPWTQKVPDIAASLERLGVRQAALDGELIAGAGGQADFGLLQATLAGEKSAALTYVLFDLLHLEGVDLSRVAQVERKALLEALLQRPPPHLAYSSHSVGNGEAAFALAHERGWEGIVSKRASAPYRGGRGDDWRKTKRLASEEFAVVGFTAPKGARAGFGSLLLARPDPRHGWRYAGRVGAGFSDELLRELSARLERGARGEPTVHVAVDDPELRRAKWIEPRLVVEVYYRGFGSQGVLRQPSLKGVRPDKAPDDLLDGDRPAAPGPGRAPARRRAAAKPADAANHAPRLTHPERVVYPDAGITKAEVAAYYQAMADWLLPEIVGRPVSIVRCPQGVERTCFFQKHHTAGLEAVVAVPLKEEGGRDAEYLVVRDLRGLMELVQFNALEFHPWGARAETPDQADRVVFDLDPGPDVPWSEVVAAARLVRERLEQVSLRSYLRTSGGKGLHVVVPLSPGCDWSLVKPFTQAFAESMAQMEPLKFVSTASKRYRKGKIFVDYLRNGRGATSVASFSLRVRAGAPVAMPLRWEELARLRSGAAFDIFSAPKRMRRLKRHPWHGIDAVRQNLDDVSRMLGLAKSR
ncbi:DNA ligase D [Vulcaniibacterium tengchongense]|uniref:DNA ligase (ATP) n=1 Tax=Vulcaniibacterium tengchongense TaxID=1273429 RepID=A0A3N4VB15_9GAMM|nr:DNA ligase D [Vulcaniibacterium tengchongense]RPE79778.1 ATP-dependent DNA ligase LigD phosphoesterase module /ATP-dependent DNA ligase LigD polymerase module [Vulcaniibacterium tengchongense]